MVVRVLGQAGLLESCRYADVRLGIHEVKYAHAENGKARGMGEDRSISFGIRVLAGEMSAWGFYGQPIGEVESNPKSFSKILTLGISRA